MLVVFLCFGLLFNQASDVPQPSLAEILERSAALDLVSVPDEVRLIEEKTLPIYSTNPLTPNLGPIHGIRDSVEGSERGKRLFLFTLRPKEKINIILVSGDSTKIQIQLGLPTQKNDPLESEIRKINRLPYYARARRIDITNPTDQSYRLMVSLAGWRNYAYKLKIERNK